MYSTKCKMIETDSTESGTGCILLMTLRDLPGLTGLYSGMRSNSVAPRFTLCQGMALNASHVVSQQHELGSS